MARYARKRSKTGIYHIILRGINRQNIFEEDEDRKRLIETVKQYKTISRYEIYGYCLMSNHVHILLGEKEESLSVAIKRICGSYVYWYNKKYNRCGHLFQERYKSETVGDDGYLLTVLRYIHQNPLKAGMCTNIKDYPWSSYKEYLGREIMINSVLVMDMLSNDREKAAGLFEKYMNEPNQDICLEDEGKARIADEEVREYFAGLGLQSMSDLQQKGKRERDEIIRAAKLMTGVSIRQLSRITGISKSVIDRA